MTICIYLRPEPRIEELVFRYSRELASETTAPLVLEERALPHVTLVHFDDVDDKTDEVWERAMKTLSSGYTVEGPFYLSIIPFPDGSGHHYVRLEVSRTQALEQAQQDMIELAVDVGARVTNLAGSAWRPHLTLAVIDDLPTQLPLLPDIVNGPSWSASPAFGTIGAFRHVDRAL